MLLPLQSVKIAMIATVLLAICAGLALAQSDTSIDSHGQEVVAVVDGHVIHMSEVQERWRSSDREGFVAWQQQTFESITHVLGQIVDDELIKTEARKRGLTESALLAVELAPRLKPVTEARVREFYAAMPVQSVPFDQVRTTIRQYLEQQEPIQARLGYIAELRRAAAPRMEIFVKAPRYSIAIAADDPQKGLPAAPVEVIEFGDFQCPYCKHLESVMSRLAQKYGDRVRFVWKDMPLPGHEAAQPAAAAAQCAGRQGHFWEYHDLLFDKPDALNDQRFVTLADQLRLNRTAFVACLSDPDLRLQLAQAFASAEKLYGISGTPTLFINGRMVVGERSFEMYENVILEEMGASRSAPVR